MSGETDLDRLIATMAARLDPETYVFATLPAEASYSSLAPRMTFAEAEGMTLILTKSEAEAQGIPFEYPCRMITLTVHSSLAAVGFLARITTALAANGISVNPVSAFHHDHLFVPEDRADEVMSLLADLSATARSE